MLLCGRASIGSTKSPLEAEDRDCRPEQAKVKMKSSRRQARAVPRATPNVGGGHVLNALPDREPVECVMLFLLLRLFALQFFPPDIPCIAFSLKTCFFSWGSCTVHTGSASEWFFLRGVLYKCLDTIQYAI